MLPIKVDYEIKNQIGESADILFYINLYGKHFKAKYHFPCIKHADKNSLYEVVSFIIIKAYIESKIDGLYNEEIESYDNFSKYYVFSRSIDDNKYNLLLLNSDKVDIDKTYSKLIQIDGVFVQKFSLGHYSDEMLRALLNNKFEFIIEICHNTFSFTRKDGKLDEALVCKLL